ncbi:hypothetical protein BDV36DRAFT_249554 [Aspergillus pseudocaelatus]|uniref:Uncharacterized protein n=1 Tax=Aspergillus pseudocaelatus TaxID=1825620 RepID=A0ABQ6WVC6_9EURO|nr:hypothetical protein BDV36DRAFT_249554 [Aspergillus pseudocaelatus]
MYDDVSSMGSRCMVVRPLVSPFLSFPFSFLSFLLCFALLNSLLLFNQDFKNNH